jgi:broad specificity phosphatase PhoE
LTKEGFDHAWQVGDVLKNEGKPFKLIVASPYFRCAQTASCIAQKLRIPIHFDLDMGEVFDDVSMVGDCRGKPQHRSPEVLEGKLKPDFPDVEWIRDENGKIKIEGKLQRFPEPFDGARMRYCYKVKKLLQQAASELQSIIMVTHGDALASVVGMLKETWIIKHIPYTAYVIGDRDVKVMKKGTNKILSEEGVYEHPEMWTLKLDPGLEHLDCSKEDIQKAHKIHEKEMEAMEKKKNQIKTVYRLSPAQHEHAAAALVDASAKDMKILLKKANSTTFGSENRIACHPDHHSKTKPEKENGAET